MTDRIAFWVDLETAYVTFTNDYIESVWHILKDFYDRELLYKGYKVVPYCSRCGTPLSDHEVALGYEEVSDPSLFVRMPLVENSGHPTRVKIPQNRPITVSFFLRIFG